MCLITSDVLTDNRRPNYSMVLKDLKTQDLIAKIADLRRARSGDNNGGGGGIRDPVTGRRLSKVVGLEVASTETYRFEEDGDDG